MKRLVVHVDHLVLRGMAGSEAAAIRRALAAELGRVRDAGAPVAGAAGAAPLRARVAPAGTAAAIGRAIAGRIVREGQSSCVPRLPSSKLR